MNRLVVIKVGGSLAAQPAVLREASIVLARLASRVPLVIIPGGGPFADTVRQIDERYSLPASAAHWMAILGMDQYAHLLASVIPGGTVVIDQGGITAALQQKLVPVLAPCRWLSAADELPHTWEVTSDSLAAYLTALLGGERLMLVKAAEGTGEEALDPYFKRALPAGVAWRTVGPRGLAGAEDWLLSLEPD